MLNFSLKIMIPIVPTMKLNKSSLKKFIMPLEHILNFRNSFKNWKILHTEKIQL